MNIFPASLINTQNHWMVGIQWPFAKGTVTMHDEGFSCTCQKKPRKACSHITNVKLRIYGVFQ